VHRANVGQQADARAGFKVNQNVNVAAGAKVVAQNRAKHGQAANVMALAKIG